MELTPDKQKAAEVRKVMYERVRKIGADTAHS